MKIKELKSFIARNRQIKITDLQRAIYIRFKRRVPMRTLLLIKIEVIENRIEILEEVNNEIIKKKIN